MKRILLLTLALSLTTGLSAMFSPLALENTIASIQSDVTIRIWDLDTGSVAAILGSEPVPFRRTPGIQAPAMATSARPQFRAKRKLKVDHMLARVAGHKNSVAKLGDKPATARAEQPAAPVTKPEGSPLGRKQ